MVEISNEECFLGTLRALKIISMQENNEIEIPKNMFVTPFLIVPLTSFLYKHKKITCKFSNQYLQTIKFPKTTQNCKTIKKTYFPLFRINEKLGRDEENSDILNKLEEIIVNNFNLGKNRSYIMFFFNELICNIQQHSKSNFNCIQAQMYGNKLAICLVDSGISIPQNYKDNGFRSYDFDVDLLKLVFRGISTKENNERGTGIPNTYNLICEGLNGSMSIFSGNSAVRIILKKEQFEFIDLKDFYFQGTIINLFFEIPKDKINWFDYINKEIIKFN